MTLLRGRVPWRLFFLASSVFAFVMAVLPSVSLPGAPPDKLLHVAAFVVLSLLASLAYPSAHLIKLVLGLIAFGALIELEQAIPATGRDASFWDWLADVLAVIVMLGVTGLVHARFGYRQAEY